MGEEQNNISLNKSASELPLYERPGRLSPDRHVPLTRTDRVDVSVHYDHEQKVYFSPNFLVKLVCVCVCVCVSRSVMSNSLQPHGLQPTRFLCLC